MSDSRQDRHEHEHTHSDGTTHSHPHTHGSGAGHEHPHDQDPRKAAPGNPKSNDLEVARELAAGEGEADLPPAPTQQGDGQEAGTARPGKPRGER